jgi:cyclopentanol dehydrogenase
MNRLRGKVAIISGAARGMGAAEARLFAEEGAQVIIGDIDDTRCAALAAEINERIGCEQAVAVRLDVSSAQAWRQVMDLADKRYGGVDVLVNNAAIVRTSDIENTSEEEWASVIAINQTGTWLGMKAVVPSMRKRGAGSIVNISSIGGLVGTPGHCAYHAAKGAVRMLSKHGAAAYGQDNIRCNTVFPGPTMTAMLESLIPTSQQKQATIASTLLKRLGRPEEIAQAVLFLASDESSFITGADLSVDGGYTAV